MLNWLNNQFSIFSFLDNNQFVFSYHQHECLIGAGCIARLEAEAGNAFEQLKIFSEQHKDWLFGHLGYDLKNETEQLTSSQISFIEFPDLFFFVPEIVIELKDDVISIGSFKNDHEEIFQSILKGGFATEKHFGRPVKIESKISKEEYEKTINELKRHILRGDCYEINFCQE
ncbi:MAG: aminodeoxychorismate synthase component I, partial [Bacteroidetes bacterium]|nr:aminodeoxychorismate synthase component I [Bacteroidota bacterium]